MFDGNGKTLSPACLRAMAECLGEFAAMAPARDRGWQLHLVAHNEGVARKAEVRDLGDLRPGE